MNHLHSLQMAIENGRVFPITSAQGRDSASSVIKSVARIARQAVCFSMGSISTGELLKVKPTVGEFRIPYPVIWLEFEPFDEGPRDIYGVLAIEQPNGLVGLFVFVLSQPTKQWCYVGDIKDLCISTTAYDARVVLDLAIQEFHRLLFLPAPYAICQLVRCLACSNIERTEHVPDAALQRARARRGKAPLFSYWTLHIRQRSSAATAAQGEIGSSPRAHLVRGHAQRYAGQWKWKQPYGRGDSGLGLVHKDYRVHPRRPQSPQAGV